MDIQFYLVLMIKFNSIPNSDGIDLGICRCDNFLQSRPISLVILLQPRYPFATDICTILGLSAYRSLPAPTWRTSRGSFPFEPVIITGSGGAILLPSTIPYTPKACRCRCIRNHHVSKSPDWFSFARPSPFLVSAIMLSDRLNWATLAGLIT